MRNLLRPRPLSLAPSRRPRRFTVFALTAAVIALAGSMFAGAAPAQADEGYDWDRWSDNWESSRDDGGWDAIVMLSYYRDGQDWWASAEFSAYGEHFWAQNETERPLLARISANYGYDLDLEFTVFPGECITWGWGRPPGGSLADCTYIGDEDILEDYQVVIQICGEDPFGWTCKGEVAES